MKLLEKLNDIRVKKYINIKINKYVEEIKTKGNLKQSGLNKQLIDDLSEIQKINSIKKLTDKINKIKENKEEIKRIINYDELLKKIIKTNKTENAINKKVESIINIGLIRKLIKKYSERINSINNKINLFEAVNNPKKYKNILELFPGYNKRFILSLVSVYNSESTNDILNNFRYFYENISHYERKCLRELLELKTNNNYYSQSSSILKKLISGEISVYAAYFLVAFHESIKYFLTPQKTEVKVTEFILHGSAEDIKLRQEYAIMEVLQSLNPIVLAALISAGIIALSALILNKKSADKLANALQEITKDYDILI